MAILPGLVGGSASVRSLNHNAEKTINYYIEAAPGTPKFKTRLQYTPGMRPFVTLGDGPIRCLFAQDGRAWGISGTSLYEFFANGTRILRGTTTADGKPATISSNGTNGNQLFITHGGKGYIYNLTTNAVAPVGDADFQSDIEPVSMGAFSDGYFFALKDQSNKFYISALNDGNSWDLLDVFQVSTVADQVKALVELHREIILFGSETSSVWQNTGDADTPFQPIGGVKILQGIIAPFSFAKIDNTVFWLGGNEAGSRVVYRMKGYTPERVSDHGVEYALNNYPRVDDAIGYAYQDEGHAFYVLYFPTPPTPNLDVDWTHWVLDIATGLWHQRATWDSTALIWTPHHSRVHCYAFGKHLVGDISGPGIYDLNLGYHSDRIVQVGAA